MSKQHILLAYLSVLMLTIIAAGPVLAEGGSNRLTRMASPIIDPVNFEDPRIISEARLVYLYHELGKDFITQGGNIQVAALQLRFAISDRLAIVASKDGYIWTDPEATLEEEEGWGNIGGGIKYAFYKDYDAIISAHLRYEFPVGDEEVLQGEGDGVIQPALSGAYGLTDRSTFMWSAGLRLPIDDDDSVFFDADLHYDYRIDFAGGAFYPNVELNVINVLDGGNRLPIADEGQDYFNLGASEADGKTLVVAGAGSRYRVNDSIDVGASFQFPLTNGSGSEIIDWRVVTDAILRF